MLDDLKLIHTRDKEDAIGTALKQWQQYKFNFGFKFSGKETIENVVFSGMGGSGLSAKVIASWPTLKVPSEVTQSYELPAFISNKTLLLITSYSGNTEEEITVTQKYLDLDESSKPSVVVIASGGALEELATKNNLPFIKLPTGYQPRATFAYQLRAICEVLESAGLVSGAVAQLEKSSEWLKGHLAVWDVTVPTSKNTAKKIALDMIGKSVVIYASNLLAPVAYKWKISFNENAKNIAWWNQFPEFNHNEFLGWTSHPVDKPYAVVELLSKFDNPRIIKRFELSERLLSGLMPQPYKVELEGDNILNQIQWGVALGDLVTLYTAILNGIDPTPVDLIEKLKTELR